MDGRLFGLKRQRLLQLFRGQTVQSMQAPQNLCDHSRISFTNVVLKRTGELFNSCRTHAIADLIGSLSTDRQPFVVQMADELRQSSGCQLRHRSGRWIR